MAKKEKKVKEKKIKTTKSKDKALKAKPEKVKSDKKKINISVILNFKKIAQNKTKIPNKNSITKFLCELKANFSPLIAWEILSATFEDLNLVIKLLPLLYFDSLP